MDRLSQKLYPISMAFLLTIVFYNIFFHLGQFPINSWDEARHGVNAYEMLKRGNYIVNTYRNKVDYWNLKPPLSFWANMAGFKIAGYNPLGLRLFSAIAAILTVFLVAVFVKKKHGKLASLLSTLTLATCPQFLINHSARTGDADALFVFFFTAAIISLLQIKEKQLFLYGSGLAFSLAFLTKSWHAGNIAIIIGCYLLISGAYKRLNVQNWVYLLLSMSIPIFIWGSIRYHYDRIEFFKGMISYDLLKRTANSIEGHIGDYTFYFDVLWKYFSSWLVIFVGLLTVVLLKDIRSFKFKSEKASYIIGICLWILIPILFFTFAKTKIRWYILPVYPPLSIAIGALASKVLLDSQQVVKTVLLTAIVMIAFDYEQIIYQYLHKPPIKPYVSILQNVQKMNDVKGYHLFFHHPGGKIMWPQNMVLASKIYGDLRVEDGDIYDFLKKDKALLVIKNGPRTTQLIKENHLVVISKNKWGYIVSQTPIKSVDSRKRLAH